MADKKKTIWNFFENTQGDKVVWIIVLVLIMFSILCIFSSTSRLLGPGQSRLDLVWDHLKIVIFGLIGVGTVQVVFLHVGYCVVLPHYDRDFDGSTILSAFVLY